jgi:hypothetical protein
MCSLPNIVRIIKSRMRWVGLVACMGEESSACKSLVARPDRKRPLGRPRHRWENVKMDLIEIGWGEGVWTGFVWLRIVTGDGLL